jgi:hypothetical protein
MTRLDCDHVSGLHDSPKSLTVYASEAEVAYAHKKKMRYGSLPEGRSYKLIDFAQDDAAPFGLSADLFGDGSVTAYLTPTHSAGSVIYRVHVCPARGRQRLQPGFVGEGPAARPVVQRRQHAVLLGMDQARSCR